MPECALSSCHRRATTAVDHPHRPENQTVVCDSHAEIIVDELSGEVLTA
jgi:hypothetical protein